MTGCLNVPEIALPLAEIDLTFPAWISSMKLRYEICTDDELPPHAASVTAVSAAATTAAKRIAMGRKALLQNLAIVTQVLRTDGGRLVAPRSRAWTRSPSVRDVPRGQDRGEEEQRCRDSGRQMKPSEESRRGRLASERAEGGDPNRAASLARGVVDR